MPRGYEVRNSNPPACPRCPAGPMTWLKASWHCLTCKYKEGCCG